MPNPINAYIINLLKIEFDPIKNAVNIANRELPFEMVAEFDFDGAVIEQDTRKPYPEIRLVASGFIGQRLHILCFTPIAGGIRVISLRKANPRERKYHENRKTLD